MTFSLPAENSPSPLVRYPRIQTTFPGSSVTIAIRNESSAFYLFGTVNYDHANYSVQVDGGPKWIGNAFSSWGDYDQIL